MIIIIGLILLALFIWLFIAIILPGIMALTVIVVGLVRGVKQTPEAIRQAKAAATPMSTFEPGQKTTWQQRAKADSARMKAERLARRAEKRNS